MFTILVVEDGDEYIDVLTRFVDGYRYIQVHSGTEAVHALQTMPIDAIFLDMRFDRIERSTLLGDHAALMQTHANDAERAWKFLEKNQGLYILNAIYEANYGHLPVIISHDFSGQPTRQAHLKKTYPSLSWISDTLTPASIRIHLNQVFLNPLMF